MANTQATPRLLTADDFLELCADGRRAELIDGEEVAMPPAGDEHGLITQRLNWRVAVHAERHGLGLSHSPDTGFVIRRDPDMVLAPDLSFTAAARVVAPVRGFAGVVPDLVAETVSPSEQSRDVLAKVGLWLDAGVRVVWVVWPEQRRIHVWRGQADCEVLAVGQTLTCPDLLPGLEIPLTDIFAGRRPGDGDG